MNDGTTPSNRADPTGEWGGGAGQSADQPPPPTSCRPLPGWGRRSARRAGGSRRWRASAAAGGTASQGLREAGGAVQWGWWGDETSRRGGVDPLWLGEGWTCGRNRDTQKALPPPKESSSLERRRGGIGCRVLPQLVILAPWTFDSNGRTSERADAANTERYTLEKGGRSGRLGIR